MNKDTIIIAKPQQITATPSGENQLQNIGSNANSAEVPQMPTIIVGGVKPKAPRMITDSIDLSVMQTKKK